MQRPGIIDWQTHLAGQELFEVNLMHPSLVFIEPGKHFVQFDKGSASRSNLQVLQTFKEQKQRSGQYSEGLFDFRTSGFS